MDTTEKALLRSTYTIKVAEALAQALKCSRHAKLADFPPSEQARIHQEAEHAVTALMLMGATV